MKLVNKLECVYQRLVNKAKQQKNSTMEVTESEYKDMNFKYSIVYNEQFTNNKYDKEFWNIAQAGPSYWDANMGGTPQILRNATDGTFMRLKCVKDGETSLAAGIRTKQAYGDGKFECEARFKGGPSTWPAIWMSHPNGSANNCETYYEVDISEYYETRDVTETTYHCPQSMRGGDKYVSVVKTPIKKGAQDSTGKWIEDGWNKFEWSWDEESITISINGQQILNIENDGDPLHYPTTPETRTFSIILSMQYGHNPWLTTPDLEQLPFYMDIRNIKYSEKVS